MEWDQKFSNIVRDTETNLARVKERLGSLPPKSPGLMNGSSSYPGLMSNKLYQSNPPPDLPGPYSSSLVPATSPAGYMPLEQSPGVIMVLQDRLDQQSRAIEQLSRTVRMLEDEKDVYHRKVSQLSEEVSTVRGRLSESGVDAHTDHKLAQWRRDMATEVHGLHAQLQRYRAQQRRASHDGDSAGHSVGGHGVGMNASFSREAHEIRRYMQEECEGFRREMDQFRNKIAKLELAVTSAETDTRDVSRRQDRLDKNLRDIYDSQHVTNKDLTKTKGDLSEEKLEIGELRESYRSLKNKLEDIECQVSDDNNHRSSSARSSRRKLTRKPPTPQPSPKPTYSRTMASPVIGRTAAPLAMTSPVIGRPQSGRFTALTGRTTATSLDFDVSSGSELDDLKTSDLSLDTRDIDTKDLVSEDDYLLTDLVLSDDTEDTLDIDDLK